MYALYQDEKEEKMQEFKNIIDNQATKMKDMKAAIKENQSKLQDQLSVCAHMSKP